MSEALQSLLATGAMTVVASGIAALAAVMSAKRAAKGSLEEVVNERVKLLLADSDTRAHDCEAKVVRLETSIQLIHGQLREALQFSASLISILRRNKITIPRGAETSLQKLLERQDLALSQSLREQHNV